MALASLSDLGARLGLDLAGDERAAALLDDVSAAVEAYTGRTFTATTETVQVNVSGGRATLPKGPVLEVLSVQVDDEDVDYTWTTGRIVTIPGQLAATVEYRHGHDTVPQAVVAVVCQIAGRAYGTKSTDSGTTSLSLGDYAIGTGGAAGAGPLGMLPDERRTLDRFRAGRRAGTATITPWVR